MKNLNVAVLGKELLNQNGLLAEKKTVHTYHSHTHIFYEIILYEPFDGYITVNGLNHTIDKPSMIFLTPTDIHSTHTNGISQSPYYKLCFESTENITTTALNSILLEVGDKFDFYKQLFENALKNKNNFLYLQTTIQLVILELENNANSISTGDKKASVVSYAMQLINQHFTEDITLESTAKQLFVTPQYLSSQFAKIAKITFTEYLNDKRLSYAANLLLNDKCNVTEACFASGYSNLSHFIRQFKKKYNKTPGKFN
ncbi:MAG: helix-turn-helix transcriptional regulator [Clostridia bacterium]|nr:helix-turn-helix transcriptional regulator [Clostridia bacterium]